jgi:uncharacterized membrane protein YccC
VEVVLLVGLCIVFFVGFLTAKQFATFGIGVLATFAIPAFLNVANTQTRDANNG